MPNPNEAYEVARKVLPIIYVLDSSGSMTGERIAAVNEAMHETMDVLKDISSNNPDAELKVAVMKFSSGAEWITNGLVFLDDFYWNDIKAAGVTDLGYALNELNNKLSRSEFLVSDTGFCVPVIMFMSDGQPTDDYMKQLAIINENNKWFRHATKIGIAVGDDADLSVLAKVAGTTEGVVAVNDLETLKALIKVASVTASMVNSKSRTDNSNSIKEIMDDVKAELSGAESIDFNFFNNNNADYDDKTVYVDPDIVLQNGWDDDAEWN